MRCLEFGVLRFIKEKWDEMNQGLEKLAEEPYERIGEHELRTRELKEEDFR